MVAVPLSRGRTGSRPRNGRPDAAQSSAALRSRRSKWYSSVNDREPLDLGGGGAGRLRQRAPEVAADDPLHQREGLGLDPPAAEPAAGLAQHAALVEVEGGERAFLAAATDAGVEQRVEALEREQLPEERGAHHRRRVGGERAQRADEHPVQRGVRLALLRDLVDGFEHRDRMGQAAVVLPELAVAVDGLDLGDDVEVAAAAVALERDVGRGLEPGPEAAARLADALGDGRGPCRDPA